jgi:hypothetical protein
MVSLVAVDGWTEILGHFRSRRKCMIHCRDGKTWSSYRWHSQLSWVQTTWDLLDTMATFLHLFCIGGSFATSNICDLGPCWPVKCPLWHVYLRYTACLQKLDTSHVEAIQPSLAIGVSGPSAPWNPPWNSRTCLPIEGEAMSNFIGTWSSKPTEKYNDSTLNICNLR